MERDLYVTSDEPILLTGQDVVVRGIRHEAVLTSRRLVLIRSDDPKAPHREIGLAAIGSAIAGENPLREPTITLTLASPDGVLNTLELVFIRYNGEQRGQYDEWVARLKDQIRTVAKGPAGPAGLPEPESPPVLPPEPPAGSPAVTVAGTGSPGRGPGLSKGAIAAGVAALFIIAAIGGLYVLSSRPVPGEGAPAPVPATSVQTPPPGTSVQTTVPTTGSVPMDSPAPTAAPAFTVPSTGIWLLVQYPGSYTGSVGSRGNKRPVIGTGDKIFQIWENEGVLDGEIQKLEKNGERLTVSIYHNGAEIKRVNTTAPGGTIFLNVPL